MLTVAAVKEMMMASLCSPLDLTDRLGLRPTGEQLEVLERFPLGDDLMDVADNADRHALRASAVCLLWRTLNHPGSLGVVVGAKKGDVGTFMAFLQGITMKIDPALAAVCKWPRWGTMRIGDDPGYCVRAVSNRPEFLQGMPEGIVTIIVLGAGESAGDGEWEATRQVAEQYAAVDGVRVIRVW